MDVRDFVALHEGQEAIWQLDNMSLSDQRHGKPAKRECLHMHLKFFFRSLLVLLRGLVIAALQGDILAVLAG